MKFLLFLAILSLIYIGIDSGIYALGIILGFAGLLSICLLFVCIIIAIALL